MENFAEWLSHHMLPCTIKRAFGFNCPFCGFQRSVIALLKGDILKSVTLFPALIPLFLTFLLFVCYHFFHISSLKKIVIGFLIGDGILLIINCIVKNIQLLF